MAHVYVKSDREDQLRSALAEIDGVERVLGRDEQGELGVGHPSSGELIAVAEADAWFCY